MYTSVNIALPYIFIVTTDITVLTVGRRKHIICHLFPFCDFSCDWLDKINKSENWEVDKKKEMNRILHHG